MSKQFIIQSTSVPQINLADNTVDHGMIFL